MIERDHPDRSIGQQCALLSIPRSSFHYTSQGETEQNLALMRLIDVQFLDMPFFGVRQMTWHLRNEDHAVNEKHIRRLMRLMGPLLADCFAIACRATDADLSEAEHQQASEGAQDLSLPLARATGEQAKSGLVCGHHLSACAQRVSLSGGDHGLAYPDGSVVADIGHAGRGLLRRRAERRPLSVRTAGHHEQRSGISVHVICLDRPPGTVRQALSQDDASLRG